MQINDPFLTSKSVLGLVERVKLAPPPHVLEIDIAFNTQDAGMVQGNITNISEWNEIINNFASQSIQTYLLIPVVDPSNSMIIVPFYAHGNEDIYIISSSNVFAGGNNNNGKHLSIMSFTITKMRSLIDGGCIRITFDLQ